MEPPLSMTTSQPDGWDHHRTPYRTYRFLRFFYSISLNKLSTILRRGIPGRVDGEGGQVYFLGISKNLKRYYSIVFAHL